MKIAIVHDWLTGMRGGEKCLEAFCELFPSADIFTLLHQEGAVSSNIERHRINTSFVQRLPLTYRYYRYYLPLLPVAIESFDLRGYDLILSSSHCVAKGVRVPPDTCHIAYIYTPMRYIWDQYDAYFGADRASWPVRMAMRAARPWLQRADVRTSSRVHHFVAISQHVADRVRKYYGRYLMVTAFAPYKRIDLAIEAFNRIGQPLKIIGSGQDEGRLRSLAGPTVECLGWRSDAEVRDAYAACRALIFPGEEDFGIVPVEAMASGKPVIAYGKGGALETVVPINPKELLPAGESGDHPPTGVLFYQQTARALEQTIEFFEMVRDRFDPQAIRRHAEAFSRQRFKDQIREFLDAKYSEFRNGRAAFSLR